MKRNLLPPSIPADLKGVSRREFIAAALAAGMSATVADSTFSRAMAQTPKKGGRLRMAVPGGAVTDTLDPGTWNETFMQVVGFGPLRNNLTEISANNEVVAELAESWEPSKDAKSWTFKLRKGVEFHSGKMLDANDVLASFNHHRGPTTTSQAKGIVNAIEDIKVDDSSTVTFVLKSGDADFPVLLADYHFGIMPAAADGSADWRSGDGTAGYQIASFDPGARALLTRAPNYWKPNAAYFSEIQVLAVGDMAARQNALITGDVDVADRVDLKTVAQLGRNPNIVIENVPGRLHYTFDMMTTADPFTDNNVRLAMKYAMDRKALLDIVLHGYGVLANDNPISPAYKYFDSSIPQRQFDPDKAKFYLNKAGKSSLAVDLHVSDVAFNGAIDASALFREQASKAGIDVNILREPGDGYFSKVWGKMSFVASYFTGRLTEDGILSIAYAKGATMNTPRWSNARADELLDVARAELDTNKRREMYSELQRLIRDEGGFIIPLFANYVFARSKKLAHGVLISSERSLDGAKMAERWWFA